MSDEDRETIHRDTAIYGTTYTYDGAPLDPTKVVMHLCRANGEISSTTTEYGVVMSGGGVHIRPDDSEIERIYPLADWIKNERRIQRARVVRRRIIVIDEWQEVTEP